ncbi:spike base protein, RCAP_Rcc01079 family [Ruegeria arenilitoris]|uniref:spike base protein, RCAP_Rcc01079 family n=1 Tax=Ruegeria arenilitoris TaxID=1173585 RepID=UPI00147E26FD|nr:hypothetical protein [Ruegeria arenilitoris]
MKNPFAGRTASLNGPTPDICPVTPNDSEDLSKVAVALYVTNGGMVSFQTVANNHRSIQVADNSILPVGVVRVYATGTDATGIHAFVVS